MIKKLLSFLVYSFFFLHSTRAQNTFERAYDTLGVMSANCVQETFDGGYVLCGTRYTTVNAQDAVIFKLDSLGNITWIKIYGGPGTDGATHIEQTPDSGYIVLALKDGGIGTSTNWLLKLDANGDTVWTKTYVAGIGSTEPTRMYLTNDSKYTCTGKYEKPLTNRATYLMSVLNNSNLFFLKTYSGTQSQQGYDVQQTFDNGYIITGARGNPIYGDVYLLRADSLGDTVWTRNYGDTAIDVGRSVQQTTDSGFIVAGYTPNSFGIHNAAYLIKTNGSGDTIWTKKYESGNDNATYSVQQTYDGGYIAAGSIVSGTPLTTGVWLLKIKANGDTAWTKKLGVNYGAIGFFVRQTKDGGYIITGQTNSVIGLYVVKTDSSGNVYFTGISEPGVCTEQNNLVYPNPNDGKFSIQHLQFNIENISVYNWYGERIYKSSSIVQNEVDLAFQPAGIYLVSIQTKNKLFSQKIIIQH